MKILWLNHSLYNPNLLISITFQFAIIVANDFCNEIACFEVQKFEAVLGQRTMIIIRFKENSQSHLLKYQSKVRLRTAIASLRLVIMFTTTAVLTSESTLYPNSHSTYE